MNSSFVAFFVLVASPLLMAQECPNGARSTGICINGKCQSGSYCSTDNICCENGTSAVNCTDLISDCAKRVHLCKDAKMKSVMEYNCDADSSPPVQPSSKCVDYHTTCRTWARNGFCRSAFYTVEEKRQMCPKSCNMC
ncbi:hypothetical protein QR680_011355 [Steinernema hermaphroditum]|uniref:ShKT domain-containing protein n=1 Tax=Steinernema hermaphroditum TaxID=289476 RepID=A0AA39MC63_9BILA|nr:hypothetical protein QR680_011355 [Steinernema hermaphroditum]